MSSDGSAGPEAPVSSDLFRRACGRFATGVAVASVLDEKGAPWGLTVSSFTSVSLDPPLILVCLGRAVTGIEQFQAARYFGINILGEDQQPLSERFARQQHDRFEGVEWHPGETGVPLLEGVLATMECAVRQRVTAGDHHIFIGEMVHARIGEGAPLIHHRSRYRRLA
jgi:flavin reductase (DIM6/NTAB) family NADH-FMN oxidoreductase RutF